MFSRRLFAAFVGLAMLAMPVAAFAGDHYHWDHPRPYAWHDRGWHNGWAKPDWWHWHWDDRHFDRPYAWNGYRWEPNRPWGHSFPRPWPNAYRAPEVNSQSLDALIAKRHNAMENIAALHAQGDSRGAARLVPIVQALNQRINSVGPYAPR
jgi:hypothetical protein